MSKALPQNLLVNTAAGLYCPQADVHIDPVRKVARAIVTHAHADHARAGHGQVWATPETLAIMQVRLGKNFAGERHPLALGRSCDLGSISMSLHSAGHVLGSAQVLLQSATHRTVISGDFKRRADPTTAPFELVRCDTFVTEATFANPLYQMPGEQQELDRLIKSLRLFPQAHHLIEAYSLGKSQRMIALLRARGITRPIYLDTATLAIAQIYTSFGVHLGQLRPLAQAPVHEHPVLALCPPQSKQAADLRSSGRKLRLASASGWLLAGKRAKNTASHIPMAISDHADWPELCQTIEECGAKEILVTHGDPFALQRWGQLRQLNVSPLTKLPSLDTEAM
ncbi:ligase-associated DNA damage response exonuclease [Polycladidibacter hongkongensis]|uniref:ligase-associated DNA damage response exonuclease n=1 Tax=Polycladidibacter hongkongensis TaxID=1647556 RepID=UPI00083285C2|nr:ligase-associated DNA damage response exonuclease [Pseudovibrio hongkongensis]